MEGPSNCRNWKRGCAARCLALVCCQMDCRSGVRLAACPGEWFAGHRCVDAELVLFWCLAISIGSSSVSARAAHTLTNTLLLSHIINPPVLPIPFKLPIVESSMLFSTQFEPIDHITHLVCAFHWMAHQFDSRTSDERGWEKSRHRVKWL